MRKLLVFSTILTLSTLLQGQDFASVSGLGRIAPKSSKSLISTTSETPKRTQIQSFSYEVDDLPICTVAPKEQGTIYRIQITTANTHDKSTTPEIHIPELGPIYREYLLNQPVTRYLAGDFSFEGDAVYHLEKIWSAGFEHAFIVKYVDGFRVSF